MNNKNLSRDSLIGFAVGDALGVPVEFLTRNEVRSLHLTDMIGSDWFLPFKSNWSEIIPSGAWSDDTSMIIAGMDSIIKNNGRIDYDDIMQNFLNWWEHNQYCSLDMAFGLGGVVSEALERYKSGCPALECGGKGTYDNGNGSLMRILPFSLYAVKTDMSEKETVNFIGKASSLTHAHDISKMGCFIYTEFLRTIVHTGDKMIAFKNILKIDYSKYFSDEAVKAHKKILTPDFLNIRDTEISEENGYIVATLESVLYSILNTENYEKAVLTAINMGYDTDTVAGITGSLAGILYGYESIPERWLNVLRKKSELEDLPEKFETLSGVWNL